MGLNFPIFTTFCRIWLYTHARVKRDFAGQKGYAERERKRVRSGDGLWRRQYGVSDREDGKQTTRIHF